MIDPVIELAADADAPPWLSPRAAYIHVPFCAHKCGYCDFASVAHAEDRIDEYLAALDAECRMVVGSPRKVDTIFIGGGAPTYISESQLERLMGIVDRWFPTADVQEFTVESNPNTLTADKVAILADAGVNRVSLGAQSFQPHLLERLERNHDPSSVPRALELIRRRIHEASIDLIFGVPGQSLDEWKSDLDAAVALQTNHISAYGLTYEKGTRLWKQRQLGVVQQTDEETELAMFEWTIDRLGEAGFDQYEISNYAREGRRCRHNLAYWANHAYWGVGTGAAAYVSGVRTLNTRELGSYIARCLEGRSPATQSETLDAADRARETAMLNLRRMEGLHREQFRTQTGIGIDELVGSALRNLVSHGLLADDGVSIRLTRKGLPLADGVLRAML